MEIDIITMHKVEIMLSDYEADQLAVERTFINEELAPLIDDLVCLIANKTGYLGC